MIFTTMTGVERRVEEYEDILKQYIAAPSSSRLFKDIFNGGLGLLREYGKGWQFLTFGSRRLQYKFPDTDGYYDGIRLHYRRRSFLEDELDIQYQRYDPNLYKDEPLVRLEDIRGIVDLDPKTIASLKALTIQDKNDLFSVISAGARIELKRLRGHELLSELDNANHADVLLRGKTIFSRRLFEMSPIKGTIYDQHGSTITCHIF